MRSRLVTLVAVPVLALGGTVVTAPGASAAPHPIIRTVRAFAAPAGGLGGITAPWVSCSDYTTDPAVRWTLTNLGTGTTRHWHWSGDDDRTRFPRVPAGHYRSRTVATCGTARATRTQEPVVRQKTRRTTMSRAEFDRIRHGMSTRQVTRIVGYPGKTGVTSGAMAWRYYDRMAFLKQAEIRYRHGRVDALWWNGEGD